MRRFFRNQLLTLGLERPGLPAALLVLALLALLLQYGLALGEYFRTTGAALGYAYPLEYGEGPVLDQVLRLARGETIYRPDLSGPPFTITAEPPLFRAVQVPFAWVFGPGYWYGRGIAVLGALAAALFIGLTLFSLTRDWVSAAAGGLLLPVFPFVLYGSALDRADTLALAFSWAGLYSVVRQPGQRRALILAAVLFALAVYTRQTYFLAGPLAAAAWLAQKRLLRHALALLGLTAGICLGLFVVLNAVSGGGFSFNLFTAASAAPFSWKIVAAHTFRLLPTLFYLVMGALLFLIMERFGNRTETWPLVLPYFVGAALAATFSGRATGGEQAFIELAAALSLAAGAVTAWAGRYTWVKILLVLALAMQVGSLLNASRQEYIPQVLDRVNAQSEVAEAARLARESGGPLLADEYMGLAPLAGEPIYFQPVEFKALAEAGLWDEDPLVEQIRRKTFPVILLYLPIDNSTLLVTRWSPAVRNAIWENYRLVDRLASIYVYEAVR